MKIKLILGLLLTNIILINPIHAGWWGTVKGWFGSSETVDLAGSALTDLLNSAANETMNQIMKDPSQISMPNAFSDLNKILKMKGKGETFKALKTDVQKAFKKTLPEMATTINGYVESVTTENAKEILNGGPTSVTDFLKKKGENTLSSKITELAKGQIGKYNIQDEIKKIAGEGSAGILGQALNVKVPEIDFSDHFSKQALGLFFSKMAKIESNIRSKKSLWPKSFKKYMESSK